MAQAADEWFFAQRAYPFGKIPSDAITKALEARRTMEGGGIRVQSSTSTVDAGSVWTPLGPSGVNAPEGVASGRVTSIATDSRNPDSIYIGAAGGGVWRSADGGVSWQSLGDNLLSLVSGALALDDRNGVLYYGTGDYGGATYGNGVLRSADGGQTWINSSGWDSTLNKPNLTIGYTPRILLHPADPNTVLVARGSGLWRSSDGGNTWAHVTGGVATDLAASPGNPNTMFLALGANSGDPGNGVYRSNDGGLTWGLVPQLPGGTAVGRITLATGRSNGALFALITRPSDQQVLGLYRSLDAGSSWTKLNPPASLFDSSGTGQGYFDSCLAVDPRDSNVVYLGGVELWKSTDGGNSWVVLSLASDGTRVVHEDQFAITFRPGTPTTVYVGNDGGIFKSINSGLSWTNLNNNLPITQFNTIAVSPATPGLILGGTQDQGLVHYNGTNVWDQPIRGDAGSVAFSASNPNLIFVAKQRIRVLRSLDGGATFASIATGINPTDRVSFYPPVAFSASSVLYFGTQRLWASSNNGTSWNAASGDLTNGGVLTALATSPILPGLIFAGSSDGVVSIVQGGGGASRGSGVPQRTITTITPDPQNAAVAYLTVSGFDSGHVFRTVDGGNSWTDISGNLPNSPASALVLDPRGPIYVATDVGVFRSEDAATWTSFNIGLPNAIVMGLAADPRSGALTAATYGRSVFQINLKAPQTGPNVFSRGVVNASSFDTLLAPGTIASIFGSRLTAGDTVGASTRPLPTTLAGTSITVNGIAAPLLYASPGQVNFQVPFEVSGSTALVVVTTAEGSTAALSPLQPSAPAIISGTVQHGTTGIPVDANNPATAGEVLVMFASGLGVTNPPVASGVASPVSPLAAVTNVTCSFGATPAIVQFAGLAPGFVGLYQVNVQVPNGVSGNQQVILNAGGRNSNAVTIAVQ